jgi:hypothetical protein
MIFFLAFGANIISCRIRIRIQETNLMRILIRIRIRNTAFHYNTISSGFRKTVFVATRGSFKPVGIEHQRLSVISGKLLTLSKLCKEVLLLRISKLETATKKVQIQTATQ